MLTMPRICTMNFKIRSMKLYVKKTQNKTKKKPRTKPKQKATNKQKNPKKPKPTKL